MPRPVADLAQLSRTLDLIRAQRIDLVLDVGANRGWYAYHLRKAGYRGQILGFEPLTDDLAHCDQLAQGDALWTNHGVAIGSEDGTRDFNQVSNAGSTVFSSFLVPQEGLGQVATITVPIRRLDTLLPELVDDLAQRRIFLKLDTQGFDLEAFRGAEGIADRVRLLQSEISVEPIYAGMPAYTDSLAHYSASAFHLADLFVVNRTREGNVLEYDCLMQRARD